MKALTQRAEFGPGVNGIDPQTVAFDVDGVVADTMNLFLEIAHDNFQIDHLCYDDFTCYDLEDCIDVDPQVVTSILHQLLEGDFAAALKPIPGAPQVLKRLALKQPPLTFVTARTHGDSIHAWMAETLELDPQKIDLIATGSYEAKAAVLRQRGISFFVEDRLETCFQLETHGITPILFRQPWNRQEHTFQEVGSWRELAILMRL